MRHIRSLTVNQLTNWPINGRARNNCRLTDTDSRAAKRKTTGTGNGSVDDVIMTSLNVTAVALEPRRLNSKQSGLPYRSNRLYQVQLYAVLSPTADVALVATTIHELVALTL